MYDFCQDGEFAQAIETVWYSLWTHGVAVSYCGDYRNVTLCAVHSLHNAYAWRVQLLRTCSEMSLMPSANGAKCIAQLAEAEMCLVPCAYITPKASCDWRRLGCIDNSALCLSCQLHCAIGGAGMY